MSKEALCRVFGRRLRHLRETTRLTQADLARASGISADHLSKMERGLSGPSLVLVDRMADILGVPPHSLFQNEISQTPHHETCTYLRELRHRMGNALAVLASLADISSMSAQTREARDRCRDLSANIRNMSLLHGMLSGQGMDATVCAGEYMQRIFHQVTALHPDHRLMLHIRAREVLLPANRAVPFGMVVFELLHNIHKHAAGADTVSMELDRDSQGNLTVNIADNGPGMGPRTQDRGGNGLALVRTLVEDQLGGSFELWDQEGLRARMVFCVTGPTCR